MKNIDQAVIEAICESIASGLSESQSCRANNIPESSWRDVKNNNDIAFACYTRAREARSNLWAEQMMEMIDSVDLSGDPMKVKARLDLLKIQIDARKWTIARILPKVYGDRTIHSGDSDAPIEMVVRKIGSKA